MVPAVPQTLLHLPNIHAQSSSVTTGSDASSLLTPRSTQSPARTNYVGGSKRSAGTSRTTSSLAGTPGLASHTGGAANAEGVIPRMYSIASTNHFPSRTLRAALHLPQTQSPPQDHGVKFPQLNANARSTDVSGSKTSRWATSGASTIQSSGTSPPSSSYRHPVHQQQQQHYAAASRRSPSPKARAALPPLHPTSLRIHQNPPQIQHPHPPSQSFHQQQPYISLPPAVPPPQHPSTFGTSSHLAPHYPHHSSHGPISPHTQQSHLLPPATSQGRVSLTTSQSRSRPPSTSTRGLSIDNRNYTSAAITVPSVPSTSYGRRKSSTTNQTLLHLPSLATSSNRYSAYLDTFVMENALAQQPSSPVEHHSHTHKSHHHHHPPLQSLSGVGGTTSILPTISPLLTPAPPLRRSSSSSVQQRASMIKLPPVPESRYQK
ncbi:hypothetical protein DFS34DRAFT_594069 [Phlyctochytrium arcticum]|nr:hypothetical protein DFS34DRAFT_594069 [Phlyctochytrium arcticum]